MAIGDAPKLESKKGLEMKDIEIGYIIEAPYGIKYRVERVIRNPKYDKDGVPCLVEGRGLDDGVHNAITFGGISPQQPVADWREWKVISRA